MSPHLKWGIGGGGGGLILLGVIPLVVGLRAHRRGYRGPGHRLADARRVAAPAVPRAPPPAAPDPLANFTTRCSNTVNVDHRPLGSSPMGEWINAAEAAQRLGVKPATLYAYVSRGMLARRRGEDGRSSLFEANAEARLAHRVEPHRAGGSGDFV